MTIKTHNSYQDILSFCTFKISRIGMRNANVFPLPVTASAATSFFWSRRGITAAWIWSWTRAWNSDFDSIVKFIILHYSSLFKFKTNWSKYYSIHSGLVIGPNSIWGRAIGFILGQFWAGCRYRVRPDNQTLLYIFLYFSYSTWTGVVLENFNSSKVLRISRLNVTFSLSHSQSILKTF